RPPVADPGHRVDQRLPHELAVLLPEKIIVPLELLLGQPAVGDVDDIADGPRGIAIAIVKDQRRGAHPADFTIRAHDAKLYAVVLALREQFTRRALHFSGPLPVLGVNDALEVGDSNDGS